LADGGEKVKNKKGVAPLLPLIFGIAWVILGLIVFNILGTGVIMHKLSNPIITIPLIIIGIIILFKIMGGRK